MRPSYIETTALGAAYAAGLAVGVWKEEKIFVSIEKDINATIFRPNLNEEWRKKKIESWNRAVERSFGLADLAQ